MARSAVCRGSRLVYGSWKTIWISPPRRRRSRADRAGLDRSRPHAVIVPLVGRSRPTIIRAIVVLPDPDSPTIASDRPGGIANETLSTATRLPNSLRSPIASRTGAVLPAPSCSDMSSLQVPAQLAGPAASRHAAVELGQLRNRRQAGRLRVRAPGRERALTGRRLERRQRPAGDSAQPARLLRDLRPGRRERRGIGMQRIAVQQF